MRVLVVLHPEEARRSLLDPDSPRTLQYGEIIAWGPALAGPPPPGTTILDIPDELLADLPKDPATGTPDLSYYILVTPDAPKRLVRRPPDALPL